MTDHNQPTTEIVLQPVSEARLRDMANEEVELILDRLDAEWTKVREEAEHDANRLAEIRVAGEALINEGDSTKALELLNGARS